ncbi:3-hydroxyisobutyrate dehydrogenase [Defluviimonas sp. 20V17]|uniref:L-threonate dehydrogenase n=1 Tax=Allgaiera indica TaxID=765699 RepID=A0AAN5A1B2_9RHOB|nr:L-threonate dehydrogenase [Allgaiera indica]KDB04318.1 3-hydroxyisobutyrate dehydrogenase [Defluviimonas sp. 20V17]GHE06331.1 oxidoreductase [Allgaiera indica]SDX91538.1 3-hydroxyisobutyrate dehydrogenase [Allgaiera indica]
MIPGEVIAKDGANGAECAGQEVAVIGLGSMGIGMAASLARAGAVVSGFDPQPAATARLKAFGGLPAAAPAAAASGKRVVVSVVVNADQTEDVLFGPDGCAAAMAEGGVFISCATMAPERARALSGRLEQMGKLFLDAPISGGSKRAAEGALTVLASGAPEAFERAAPALEAMAATLYRLGDAPGQAAAFKMVNQLLAGVHIAAASEAITFASREGLDLAKVYEVISKSAGNSWMFENRIPHVLEGDYTPHSAVSIFVKDLGIVMDMARSRSFPVPMAGAALQMFLMTAAAGMAADDDASVARLYAQVADLALPGMAR